MPAEVKMAASRRDSSLKMLFEDMWTLYEKTPTEAASAEGSNARQSQ